MHSSVGSDDILADITRKINELGSCRVQNMGLLGEANHSFFLLSILVWLVQRDRSRSISIFSSNIPHFHAGAGVRIHLLIVAR